jgi:selenide, water dikinase
MEAFTLLPDPQTNGGLLVSVKEESLAEVKNLLLQNALAEMIARIGKTIALGEKLVYINQ